MNRFVHGVQSETEVLDQEQSLDQNIQIAQFKNLRIRFESTLKSQFDSELLDTIDKTDLSRIPQNDQISFLIDFFNQIDLSSQTNSNYVLMINKIKTLTTYLDFMNVDKNDSNFDFLKNQLIEFLVTKLDFMFNRLKISKSSDVTNNLNTLINLMLKLMRKYFQPEKLILHYKKFITFLKITKNNKILNELLNIWNEPNLVIYKDNKDQLLPILKKNLSNSDYKIRSKCLSILTYHYTFKRTESDDGYAEFKNKIIKILLNFLDDPDPRVRITALELMILLHCNGISVSVDHYDDIKQNLYDDFDQVRLLSTQMISLLAFSYPEFQLSLTNGQKDVEEEKIRLADDVFSKVCFMINDIALEVRVCASNLLGKINLVSSRFLLQTLDKKLMSDLKLRKIQKFRQKTLVSNEFGGASGSSGTIIGESSDSQIDEDDNLNLITQGACGAFIHGLEDEFLEVRSEAVDSLCKLAINCPKLAAKTIDFLVDMFNDEIELVRLKAILALNKILHYVLLGDDQIDIVVSVIEDSSFDIRESLKDLLSNCKLATKIGLRKTVQALLKNLNKYPNDKMSIWRCFKNLGRNHSKFVMSLISYLINLHPFIDLIEPDINDNFYISTLIMILNSVNQNSAIIPLLPKYIFNHYFYIKLKLPNLIPSIKLIENYSNSINILKPIELVIDEENKENMTEETVKSDEMISFFLKTKSSLKNLSQNTDMATDGRLVKLYESFSNDLSHLSEMDLQEGQQNISIICEIMKLYLECFLIVKKQNMKGESNESGDKIHYQRLIQIEQALLTSIRLILLYKGYHISEKVTILKMYLYLRALYLREFYLRKNLFNSFLNSYLKLNINRKDFIKECRLYVSLLKYFENLLDSKYKCELYKIIHELPIELPGSFKLLSNSGLNDANNLEILLLSEDQIESNYEKICLDLIEPVDNLDNPIRFQPGLVSLIKIKATLYNFTRFDNLFIQITYSDNDKQFIPIDSYSIKHLSQNKHILDTSVYLSNLALTDNCMIKMCITMLIDEFNDIKENVGSNCDLTNEQSTENTLTKMLNSTSNSNNLNEKILKNNLYPIELSNNVKIYFEPLARKFH
ncbi:unnamed protein product [Brachionus calyciflorus]|uniref:Integrator complex subunit 4/Protein SIEL C-terminal Ig-like domain-containing protein n=1 Tax=Brachionus calyciflorus TaxID=104777 RepID=A0A813YDY2_9BILA|nr:unnamed protein product [Brachionus calyciflorus]